MKPVVLLPLKEPALGLGMGFLQPQQREQKSTNGVALAATFRVADGLAKIACGGGELHESFPPYSEKTAPLNQERLRCNSVIFHVLEVHFCL